MRFWGSRFWRELVAKKWGKSDDLGTGDCRWFGGGGCLGVRGGRDASAGACFARARALPSRAANAVGHDHGFFDVAELESEREECRASARPRRKGGVDDQRYEWRHAVADRAHASAPRRPTRSARDADRRSETAV